MASLSASYEKTLALLDAKQAKQASQEFRSHFLPVAKRLYGEAPKTYPTRFSKINDWCSWIRNLYLNSMKADTALAGKDPAQAAKLVASLREHFYALHKETQTESVSDAIYAFRQAAAASPAADQLKSLRAAVDKATPSVKAKADAAAFASAKGQWTNKVDPILSDGKVDASELATLRVATETFYRAFGVQFE